MNLKKSISLFVMLFAATTLAFAANNTRNVYSVYSDNFNGSHFDAADSDEDSIKHYTWSGTITPSSVNTNAPGGKEYTRLSWVGNLNWNGCGWTSTNSNGYQDMSAYYGGTIKFLVRSSNSKIVNCRAGIEIKGGIVYKTLEDLGFSANGQWQEITVNLNTSTDSRFTSENLAKTSILFILSQDTFVEGGNVLEVDNIRWVKSGNPAEFSVTTKNVSNNSEVSEGTISFAADSFGKGWSVAEQYLEMDVDGEFQNNNWKIRVYTNNDINGLYNIDNENDVLPMAWKISCSTLPYVYTDYDAQGTPFQNKNTYEIGENKSEAGEFFGLYDAGKVEFLHDEGVKWLYPWFFVKANGDTSEYSVIWQNVSGNPSQSGCHTFENTDTGGVVHEYYDALTNFYERKPKLFLACDTKKATAAKYTANLVLNLSYE